jgi:predicted transcriptional regulator
MTTTQARAARFAALLVEEPELETRTAETIRGGLEAVWTESGLSTTEVLARRRVTRGRLSPLEHRDVNPQLSSITQQADALDDDATIVFTPRNKASRAVRVAVRSVAAHP